MNNDYNSAIKKANLLHPCKWTQRRHVNVRYIRCSLMCILMPMLDKFQLKRHTTGSWTYCNVQTLSYWSYFQLSSLFRHSIRFELFVHWNGALSNFHKIQRNSSEHRLRFSNEHFKYYECHCFLHHIHHWNCFDSNWNGSLFLLSSYD